MNTSSPWCTFTQSVFTTVDDDGETASIRRQLFITETRRHKTVFLLMLPAGFSNASETPKADKPPSRTGTNSHTYKAKEYEAWRTVSWKGSRKSQRQSQHCRWTKPFQLVLSVVWSLLVVGTLPRYSILVTDCECYSNPVNSGLIPTNLVKMQNAWCISHYRSPCSFTSKSIAINPVITCFHFGPGLSWEFPPMPSLNFLIPLII